MTDQRQTIRLMRLCVILLSALLIIAAAGCILFGIQLTGLHKDVVSLQWEVEHIDIPKIQTDGGSDSALAAFLTSGIDLQEIDRTLTTVQDAAKTLKELDLSALNDTASSLKGAADTLSAVDITALNKAVSSLQGAANKLSELNMDGLNEAVSALSAAAKQLEKLDVENLNEVISNLETVTAKLQNLFGR